MNHTLSDSLLEAMIKSAVNSSGPLPPDEKFSQLVSALRELQERRKADSEPVAWLLSGGGAKNVVCFDSGNAYADPLREVTPLYRHAQPAKTVQPVMFIDGDISSEDADKLAKVIREFNEEDERPLAKMARIIRENPHPTNECDMPKAQSAPVVLDEVTAEDCPAFVKYDVTEVDEAWVRGFNACRAAKLAAAPQSPGSEPATVPGKWIPVSEQMPEREVDVQVYCVDKKEQMVAYLERNELEGYFRFATWRTGDGIYCQPTHWMPLPEAPQEDINALIPLVSRNEREVK
ncbi:hypothetical protein BB937_28240 [Klebsiella pneumoniae]|nr:hypothetical protein BB937_28240 [Klebsiella pneumoniae]